MSWKAKHDDLKDKFRKEALKNKLAIKSIDILSENVVILQK